MLEISKPGESRCATQRLMRRERDSSRCGKATENTFTVGTRGSFCMKRNIMHGIKECMCGSKVGAGYEKGSKREIFHVANWLKREKRYGTTEKTENKEKKKSFTAESSQFIG